MQTFKQHGFTMVGKDDSKTYLDTKARIESLCDSVRKAMAGENISGITHAVPIETTGHSSTNIYITCYVRDSEIFFGLYDRMTNKNIMNVNEATLSMVKPERFDTLEHRMHQAIDLYKAGRELNIENLKESWERTVFELDHNIETSTEEIENLDMELDENDIEL